MYIYTFSLHLCALQLGTVSMVLYIYETQKGSNLVHVVGPYLWAGDVYRECPRESSLLCEYMYSTLTTDAKKLISVCESNNHLNSHGTVHRYRTKVWHKLDSRFPSHTVSHPGCVYGNVYRWCPRGTSLLGEHADLCLAQANNRLCIGHFPASVVQAQAHEMKILSLSKSILVHSLAAMYAPYMVKRVIFNVHMW